MTLAQQLPDLTGRGLQARVGLDAGPASVRGRPSVRRESSQPPARALEITRLQVRGLWRKGRVKKIEEIMEAFSPLEALRK